MKPSLEGWKQEHYPADYERIKHLETFLRGMETPITMAVPSRTSGLETFLRGMETQHRKPDGGSERALETFLRGMETLFYIFLIFFNNTLKPSLEGWKHLYNI